MSVSDEATVQPAAASGDGRDVDWSRVCQAVFQVRVHYRYTYSGPVTSLRQRLVVVPPDRHLDQRLTDHHLDVRGASGTVETTWEWDGFGNRVCRLLVPRIERAIDFDARYRVVRTAVVNPTETLTSAALRRYTQPTALTAPDDRLHAVASDIGAATTDPDERVERAEAWAADAIAYQFGVTGYQTPAAMALHLGRGVCQDYTHILLCVLRLLDVPARYVSGHLLGEGAPHAWVEALLPEPGPPGAVRVLALDPTHRRRTGLNYVTVAVGSDFADITPTSGSFSGPGIGRLSYTKRAEILDLRLEPGAAPAREPAA